MSIGNNITSALAGACSLLLIVACSSPTTLPPVATKAEIAAEKQNQYDTVKNNPFPAIVEPVERTVAMEKRLQKVAMRIAPQATKLCHELFGMNQRHPCNYKLELSGNAKGVNAYADGERVVVTPSMMLFAQDDNHLAFVLAHEMAHNIMSHPDRAGRNATIGGLLGAAVDIAAAAGGAGTGGTFSKLGAQGAMLQYSPDFEHEADYIGLYILERANYDIAKAPDFWRAMSQYSPDGMYVRSTHPTNPERYVTMKKTINEINSKKKLGMALLPEFKPAE